MLEWADDLKIAGLGLYLDSRQMRGNCFVSHAHSDHICRHHCAIATEQTAALMAHRLKHDEELAREGAAEAFESCTIALPYRQMHRVNEQTTIQLLPAGHVLGSAMLHLTRPEGTLLYTGDFKLRESLTVERAELAHADYLVMESTYGLPEFRFPDPKLIAEQLVETVTQALRDNRQPIVMGYSLGKAQEITKILTDAGLVVTQHGAAYNLTKIYEELGAGVGPVRRYSYGDFHGAKQLDLHERGVLVAPPNVARSSFVTRFENPCRIVMTGWALLKNAIYRYGVDHALPLSDHADFEELLETVERVRPKKIFTHHGFPEFAEHLRMRGFDAQLARPADQLSLFDS
ncbi:MAG TPA: MBL fold metallo-hydrolase [Tepidisphaeraceae bacterium]|jgi:Cft2 family RNA processing exonuclease